LSTGSKDGCLQVANLGQALSAGQTVTVVLEFTLQDGRTVDITTKDDHGNRQPFAIPMAVPTSPQARVSETFSPGE
jgi:hypothetical protein